MIRRLVVTGVACAAFTSVVPASSATAAVEVQVTGQFVSSATVSNQDISVSFCATAGDGTCVTPEVDAAGSFSVMLTPDAWNVDVRTKQGTPTYWSASAQTEILDSANWTLQLPELSRVSLRVRDADGVPLPDLYINSGSDYDADALTFSDDLPTFTASSGITAPDTDAEGRTVFHVLPDADREIQIIGQQDELEYRVPLVTPNQTSVDATSDVSVRAKALPIHNVSFRVEDYAGRWANAGNFQVTGAWGEVYAPSVPATGPATFPFPEGEANLRVYSADRVWYLPASWYFDQPLDIASSDVFTLTLPEPVRTRATVVDADTSEVAEGVRVQVGGAADPATLSPGLEPAQLTNGRLRGTSNADGGAEFRAFADTTLTASATLQGPGLYRTAPDRDVDASADNDLTLRLPKSVVIDLDVTDAEGAQIEDATGALRVSREFIVPFADGPDGRAQMRITPGPAIVEAHLGRPNIIVTRDVVVTEDTTLEYQRPELVEVTVVALDWRGAVIGGSWVSTDGTTTVETDAGPVKAQFYSGASLTNAQGVGVVVSPPSNQADVSTSSPGAYGRVDDITLTEDRTVVVQAQNSQVGSGLPYTLFDAPDPLTLDADSTLSWQPVDAEWARFSRYVLSPFGDELKFVNEFGWFGGPVNPVPVHNPDGATTCVRGEAGNEDGVTAFSPMVCRTRPMDDKVFTRSGTWQRVQDDAAYGDRYVTSTDHRAALTVWGVDIPAGDRPGEVSLLAYTGPNAGSVRLRIRDQWVSAPMSLQGPVGDEPTVLEVPINRRFDRAGLKGKLEIVVVSDDQRVRIDGFALPVPTMPDPFLPPL